MKPLYTIVLGCFGLMALYSISQDMVTVRLSREYFTVAHDPRDVPFDDPTLMAIGWGLRGGGGPGVILGLVLGMIATAGSAPPLTLRDLMPGLAVMFVLMAWTTIVCGVAGYYVATVGDVRLGGHWGEVIPPERQARFVAVACAHLGAYASGVVGGVAVGVWAGRKRGRWRTAGGA